MRDDASSGLQFVFGYGSLAADHGGAVARLRGHRRVWGVAMDNRRDLPGYKHYRLRCDGSRPHVCVAFLDLEVDAEGTVNGVALPVDDALLHVLDRRERNYRRVKVTDAIEDAAGTVWAYVGTPQARARLRDARDRGRAVVSRDYLAAVRSGFCALGPEQAVAFERSSKLDDLELWDLVRVEHGESPGALPAVGARK